MKSSRMQTALHPSKDTSQFGCHNVDYEVATQSTTNVPAGSLLATHLPPLSVNPDSSRGIQLAVSGAAHQPGTLPEEDDVASD
jgi:ribosomal protein L31